MASIAGAAERDLKEDNSVSGKYVSRDMDGYSDLDDNGSWRDEPEYGHVWYPNEVEPDWAPYSSGYWSWVGPWGWTWVRLCALGFRSFPLRPLGIYRLKVGLGAPGRSSVRRFMGRPLWVFSVADLDLGLAGSR